MSRNACLSLLLSMFAIGFLGGCREPQGTAPVDADHPTEGQNVEQAPGPTREHTYGGGQMQEIEDIQAPINQDKGEPLPPESESEPPRPNGSGNN